MGIFSRFFKNKENKEKENKEKENKQDIEEKIEKPEEIKPEIKTEEIKTEEIKPEETKIEEIKQEEKIDKIKEINSEENKIDSLSKKLFKTRDGFFGKIKNFLTGKDIISDEIYEELEDMLILSDIGMDMTKKIISDLEKEIKVKNIKNANEVYPALKDVMKKYLISENNHLSMKDGELNVILIVGVNGVGKTTTIGKIASKLIKSGKKVVLGAGDTFRAAAVEQLEEWAKRSGAEIVMGKEGGDPGSVVFDTLKKAEEIGADVAIIDTAGRLHNKGHLMKELEKINNIIRKKIGNDHYESLLVIDGTTGQNGLNQAKEFNEVTDLTGFIITKLDGTSKGGIVFSISENLKKPIKFIGVGEKIEDLRNFDASEYIDAIFK